MWVVLNRKWIVRSSQDGLELMTSECNISLGLSDLRFRTKLSKILKGEQEIPEDISEDVKRLIESLLAKKIIQITNQKLQVCDASKIEKILWGVRNKLVGSRGPVKEVYWLDKKQSRFSPVGSEIFIAEYLEMHGKNKKSKTNLSFGISEDGRETAELKAIMEALERHSSGVIPYEELIKASARKIGRDAIDPQRVISYDRLRQGNFTRNQFSPDREYYWKEVRTFPQNKKKYLPVECLYYPIDEQVAPYPYMLANSSGVAAGFNFEEAFLRGLYETIERDAFMIAWLNRVAMPRIQRRTIPGKTLSRIAKIEELRYSVFLVNLTLDLTPVVLAVAVGRNNRPALVLGLASDSDILEACSKAISEVEQQLYWQLRYSVKNRSIREPKRVKEIPDHRALYWTSRYLSKAEFLWSGREQPLKTRKVNLEMMELVNYLNSQGKEIIVADLTAPVISKAGIHIIRVIPLGLIPITFGYGNMPLGMSRLKEVNRGDQWLGSLPFVHPFS